MVVIAVEPIIFDHFTIHYNLNLRPQKERFMIDLEMRNSSLLQNLRSCRLIWAQLHSFSLFYKVCVLVVDVYASDDSLDQSHPRARVRSDTKRDMIQ